MPGTQRTVVLALALALFDAGCSGIAPATAPVPVVVRQRTTAEPSPTFPPPHEGHPLCIHYDVVPVSLFIDDFYDSLGHHYHGWKPPAGPPFYVRC
jgi:hypothetical protein